MTTYTPGDIVSVRTAPNVMDRNGQRFRALAVITSGPVTLNMGKQGYTTLGAGEAAYPFDQTCHHADDMLTLGDTDGLTVYGDAIKLAERYRAFRAWAYR